MDTPAAGRKTSDHQADDAVEGQRTVLARVEAARPVALDVDVARWDGHGGSGHELAGHRHDALDDETVRSWYAVRQPADHGSADAYAAATAAAYGEDCVVGLEGRRHAGAAYMDDEQARSGDEVREHDEEYGGHG